MAQHTIQIGEQEVPLPSGMTVAEWAHERTYWQNPRIRAFLGCIRLLAGVMESNYAILHCSPDRLLEIWRKVREVSELMLTQVAPLLDTPSPVPALEDAREHAEVSLAWLADHVLDDLHRLPRDIQPEQMMEVRKLLCVSIGKIHAFLQDTFGRFMAGDPRSIHDADYFLSKRFPQDVEEAEWLHLTVKRLQDFVAELSRDLGTDYAAVGRSLRREQTLPTLKAWMPVKAYLQRLLENLTPKLKEVLALRGIRFHEMEILDRYASEIPVQCSLLIEHFEVARQTTELIKGSTGQERSEREQSVRDLMHCHTVYSARLAALMGQIESALRDLTAFVPLWLDGIEMRRALLLRRTQDSHDDFV